MKKSDIKALSVDELQAQVAEEKQALQKLRFAHAVSGIENPMLIRETRRTIARMLTEIRARELSETSNNA